jgi:seryl-tRNA synthetase
MSSGPGKHLRFLERRMKWLKERVAKSTDTEFTFDKSEIAALEWAITNLQHTRVIAHRVEVAK